MHGVDTFPLRADSGTLPFTADSLPAPATSLRYAMVIVGISNVWAAFHYYMGSRTYREDLAATARLNAAAA